MKVYIVKTSDEIRAIFSTRKKADKYIKLNKCLINGYLTCENHYIDFVPDWEYGKYY